MSIQLRDIELPEDIFFEEEGDEEEGLLGLPKTLLAYDEQEQTVVVEQQHSADRIILGLAVLLWSVCMLSFPSEERVRLWYMPLIGVCSATVGNAFPVAGGVLFVPVLLLLQVPRSELQRRLMSGTPR